MLRPWSNSQRDEWRSVCKKKIKKYHRLTTKVISAPLHSGQTYSHIMHIFPLFLLKRLITNKQTKKSDFGIMRWLVSDSSTMGSSNGGLSPFGHAGVVILKSALSCSRPLDRRKVQPWYIVSSWEVQYVATCLLVHGAIKKVTRNFSLLYIFWQERH